MKNQDIDVLSLNDRSLDVRIEAQKNVEQKIRNGDIILPSPIPETNNHIHTRFSFAPGFPSLIAYEAIEEELETVGSIDHDSYAAAPEMKESGARFGIGTTVGFELRVDFSDLGFGNKRINNPDSVGIAYVIAHAVPVKYIGEVADFLQPIQVARNLRNMRMVSNLNSILDEKRVQRLDWNSDILPISEAAHGGSITERHILYALSNKILEVIPQEKLLAYVEQNLGITTLTDTNKSRLVEERNPHLAYDLLDALKSSFLPSFYIQPNSNECIPSSRFVSFVRSVQGLQTDAYLGDILADAKTGDKKAQAFEDDYIDQLVPALKAAGFTSMAYMIPRNTDAQLARIMGLSDQYVMMQINGVDKNSSRHTYRCKEFDPVKHSHLNDSAWALVGHEYEVAHGRDGLSFEPNMSLDTLKKQIAHYATIGRESVKKSEIFIAH